MAAYPQPRPLSVAEYLEREKSAEVRHEYLAGQVFAMAGASDVHNTISLNVAAELRARLRGRPCRVFITDMKLRVRAAETFYYPDVFVTCDPGDTERFYKERPAVIFEILSPGTEATDRREKLLIYGRIDSLRDYVLVSQERRRVELHHRAGGEAPWETTVIEGQGAVALAALGVELPLAEIYLDAVEP